MVTGRPPYTGANHIELLKSIERNKISFPPEIEIPETCKDLLRRLLTRNPVERISFDDFFSHPFLAEEPAPEVVSSSAASLLASRDLNELPVEEGDEKMQHTLTREELTGSPSSHMNNNDPYSQTRPQLTNTPPSEVAPAYGSSAPARSILPLRTTRLMGDDRQALMDSPRLDSPDFPFASSQSNTPKLSSSTTRLSSTPPAGGILAQPKTNPFRNPSVSPSASSLQLQMQDSRSSNASDKEYVMVSDSDNGKNGARAATATPPKRSLLSTALANANANRTNERPAANNNNNNNAWGGGTLTGGAGGYDETPFTTNSPGQQRPPELQPYQPSSSQPRVSPTSVGGGGAAPSQQRVGVAFMSEADALDYFNGMYKRCLNVGRLGDHKSNLQEHGPAAVLYVKALRLFQQGIQELSDYSAAQEISFDNNGQKFADLNKWMVGKFHVYFSRLQRAEQQLSDYDTPPIAEQLMYEWALQSAKEAAVDELMAQNSHALKKYKRAYRLFEQLSMEVEQGSEDQLLLEKYMASFLNRIDAVQAANTVTRL